MDQAVAGNTQFAVFQGVLTTVAVAAVKAAQLAVRQPQRRVYVAGHGQGAHYLIVEGNGRFQTPLGSFQRQCFRRFLRHKQQFAIIIGNEQRIGNLAQVVG